MVSLSQVFRALEQFVSKTQTKYRRFGANARGDDPKYVDSNFSIKNAKALKRSNGLVAEQIDKNTSAITGNGYHFTVQDEKNQLQIKAKSTLEAYCKNMRLKEKHKQIAEEMQVAGDAYAELAYDNYGTVKDIPPNTIVELEKAGVKISDEVISPPSPNARCLGILRVLPAENIKPLSNGSKVICYVYEDENGKITYFMPNEIIQYSMNTPAGQFTGVGLVEPIYSETKELDSIIAQIPVTIRNYSVPKRVWNAPNESEAKGFQEYLDSLEDGQDIVAWGNIKGESVEVSGNFKFEGGLDYLTARIKERLKSPLKEDLKSATDSNASEIRKDYQTFISEVQDKIREIEEEQLFTRLLMNHSEFVTEEKGVKKLNVDLPLLNWGIPKNGLEEIDRSAILMEAVKQGKVDVFDLCLKLELPVVKATEAPEPSGSPKEKP